ncbi:helix-turn-helix transcriptional regulator [Streptomyces sp. NBC_01571]|uniref:helix-turn-helix domain-containing protein n=1 Tax=Streptomyces sp. NBC_01571 TaxID=2975883 RepID=UPI00224F7E4D|nr:helix-turn-helix transcriptional regulator [Streptomyces sp. NBC_01571]MCX4571869.1 helix-turn-helix transcriptional regulator [Streptomyces sp. NBC_01571]
MSENDAQMTDQPPQLFTAIDSLLAAVDEGTVLPAPAERVRLREAAGLTQAAVAQALGLRVPSIIAWEAGRAEPRGERLEAYRRLIEGLAHRYPAPATPAAPAPPPGRDDAGRRLLDPLQPHHRGRPRTTHHPRFPKPPPPRPLPRHRPWCRSRR